MDYVTGSPGDAEMPKAETLICQVRFSLREDSNTNAAPKPPKVGKNDRMVREKSFVYLFLTEYPFL